MMKGKVVLVPFPFDDLSTSKVRPAVCLIDPVGPHRHDRVTSDIHAPAAPSDDGHDCTYQAGTGRIIAPNAETFYYFLEWFGKPRRTQRDTEKKQRPSASSAVNIFAMIHFIQNKLKSLQMQDEVANKLQKQFGLA